MAETNSRTVKVAGRTYDLQRTRVERTMRGVLPNPVKSHFVVIGGHRYPPKQVIGRVTGLDLADFTTHQARRILTGLGFVAGRRTSPSGTATPATTRREAASSLADALRSLTGKWVAVAGDEILVAADTPHEAVEWLSRHGLRAESMFRVPEDETAASGIAPG